MSNDVPSEYPIGIVGFYDSMNDLTSYSRLLIGDVDLLATTTSLEVELMCLIIWMIGSVTYFYIIMKLSYSHSYIWDVGSVSKRHPWV